VRGERHVIALIEDDPLVRVPLAQGLDVAGYTVIAAASGPEALEVLIDPAIDVALIDIRLPGRLDGIAVVREARRHNPTLQAIFMSGRPPPEDIADLGVFLPKPFRVSELVTVLAWVLTPPASRTPPLAFGPRSS
jgi:DNA-binding response OmpR family regulator